jgi:cytosine/creatinine deaminase
VTTYAARTLGLEKYGIAEGNPASFVLVDAPDRWDAIRRLAPTTLVIKDGAVMAETRPPQTRLMGEVVDLWRDGGRGMIGEPSWEVRSSRREEP